MLPLVETAAGKKAVEMEEGSPMDAENGSVRRG
jgi:hypothetical protein